MMMLDLFGLIVWWQKYGKEQEQTFFYVSLRSDIDISICVTFTSIDKATLLIGPQASEFSTPAAIARGRTASREKLLACDRPATGKH